MPLVFGSRIIGMMTIDDPGERRQFTQREVALAEGIGAQAAVAIENARLFEAEHRIAETLQESLLAFPDRAARPRVRAPLLGGVGQ